MSTRSVEVFSFFSHVPLGSLYVSLAAVSEFWPLDKFGQVSGHVNEDKVAQLKCNCFELVCSGVNP